MLAPSTVRCKFSAQGWIRASLLRKYFYSPCRAFGQGQGPWGPGQRCVQTIFSNGLIIGLLNFSFLDDYPLKLPSVVWASLGSPWLSPSEIFGWWYGWKDPQERHAISFFPNFPVLQGKDVFGLKTEWLYHQPEPWMKSLPLKLNKQPGLHSHPALSSWNPFGLI